jgi:hypothetical protein
MSSLLVRRLGGGWIERATPMIAARRRMSPRSASRRQVWAHRPRRLWRRRRHDVVGTFGGGRHAVGSAPGPLIRAVGSIEGDGHRAEGYRPVVTGALRDGRAPHALRKRKNPGDDLFSRKAALSVSSALESLTSVFGMGTGMASPPVSPGFVASGCCSAATTASPKAGGGAVLAVDLRYLSQDVDRSTIPSH